MRRWQVGLARLAYWLACVSCLCMVWMALTYPLTHPRRLPPLPVQVVWWTLCLYAPVSIVLGAVAWQWIWFRSGSKQGLSHARAAILVGSVACCAIAFSTFDQIQTRTNFNHGLRSCMSNEKAVTLGFLMYAQDYDDHFPLASSWNETTFPYLKNESFYRCPQEVVESLPSYGMNRQMARASTNGIDHPDASVLVIDAAPGVNRLVGKLDSPFTDRHEGGVNVAFVDGHTHWKKTEETRWLEWNLHYAKKKR